MAPVRELMQEMQVSSCITWHAPASPNAAMLLQELKILSQDAGAPDLLCWAQVALALGGCGHAELFAQATARPVTFSDFERAVSKIMAG